MLRLEDGWTPLHQSADWALRTVSLRATQVLDLRTTGISIAKKRYVIYELEDLGKALGGIGDAFFCAAALALPSSAKAEM